MLILEIVLTIFAWRKGWKWLSLLPMGIALTFGFMLGIGIGASGGDVQSAQGFGIFLDILAVIALIVMLIVKPKSKTEPEEPKTNI